MGEVILNIEISELVRVLKHNNNQSLSRSEISFKRSA
jgi:hypothetical protein